MRLDSALFIHSSPFPRPMWLSSDSSSFVNCRAHLPHESANLSIGSIFASVVKLLSSSASNGEFAGGSPAGCTNSRRVSPTTRDAPLRTERLGVEIPHAAPDFASSFGSAGHFAHVVQCRDDALKTRTVSVQLRPWAPPRVAQCRGVPLKPERL